MGQMLELAWGSATICSVGIVWSPWSKVLSYDLKYTRTASSDLQHDWIGVMDNLQCLVFTLVVLYIFILGTCQKMRTEIESPFLHPLTAYILLHTDSLIIHFVSCFS